MAGFPEQTLHFLVGTTQKIKEKVNPTFYWVPFFLELACLATSSYYYVRGMSFDVDVYMLGRYIDLETVVDAFALDGLVRMVWDHKFWQNYSSKKPFEVFDMRAGIIGAIREYL